MARIFIALVFLYANLSLADHGPSEINWWHFGSAYADSPAIGWLSITFLIFAFMMFKAIKGPLTIYLETRSKDIRNQIEEGKRAREEAEKQLKIYDQKLLSLDYEIDNMKRAIMDAAHAEAKERERTHLENEARILRDIEDTIKANMEKLRSRLAQEVIAQTFKVAEETLLLDKKSQIDQHLKDGLIKDLHKSAKAVTP